ncbi:hypothetical protein [Bacillus sp. 2205SS5-2]|uniref:hypothetical protein n=1 Tax=Bacillus sp. 2205SS5-2 TaxID=3109031 RepID=UPI003004E8B2
MEKYICTTCGTQYPPSSQLPSHCVICSEERQYVNPEGQKWTTLTHMLESQTYNNSFQSEQKGLTSLTTEPRFGIGQTAYVVEEKGFRLLWDCLSYLDQDTKHRLLLEGGLDAIALSHPHYYSTQVEWAEAFNCPIYIHEDDKQWVQRPSDQIIFWSGETNKLSKGITLHRLGGHFKGGAVLHFVRSDEKMGILLSGDIIQVVADNNWVSFMYSYPNLIPLPGSTVERIAHKVKPLPFSQLYNAFQGKIPSDADQIIQKSAQRYIAALNGEWFQT